MKKTKRRLVSEHGLPSATHAGSDIMFEMAGVPMVISDDGEEHGFNTSLITDEQQNEAREITIYLMGNGIDTAKAIEKEWKYQRNLFISAGEAKKGESKLSIKRQSSPHLPPQLEWRAQIENSDSRSGERFVSVVYGSHPVGAFVLCNMIAPAAAMYSKFIIDNNKGRDFDKNPLSENESIFLLQAYLEIIHPQCKAQKEIAKS